MGSVKKKANDASFRRVSAKEIRELSGLPWIRDEVLSTDIFEARALPDGRVLWVFSWEGPKKGKLFPSRASAEEAHLEYLESCREAAKGPVNHTRTLLPAVDDFLRDVDTHAKSLGTRIKVAEEALDGSVASLSAVDKALKRIPWIKRQVPDLVTPLVAYVGEVMRRASGGRWTKSPTSNNPNEPMVTARNGRLFQPYGLVFLPMVEPSRRVPLRAAVETLLTVSGYRPAP